MSKKVTKEVAQPFVENVLKRSVKDICAYAIDGMLADITINVVHKHIERLESAGYNIYEVHEKVASEVHKLISKYLKEALLVRGRPPTANELSALKRNP